FKSERMHPSTEMAVKSKVKSVHEVAQVGKPVTLKWFAFSGAPDIDKVELSDDDGATWSAATLDSRHSPHAWRRWSFAWTPQTKGTAHLVVRATDSRGASQPRYAVWNQSGYLYNAWHEVT